MSQQQITGLDECIQALKALPDKLRKGALRNALAAGGRVFRDEAKRLAPVLRQPVMRNGRMIRDVGTVRKAIAVRTSKVARRSGDVGVFVNVKPAKGGKRGALSPNDPFYWRWLEFGRKARGAQRRGSRGVGAIGPRRFLARAVDKSQQALQAITKALGPAVQKMNRKGGTK